MSLKIDLISKIFNQKMNFSIKMKKISIYCFSFLFAFSLVFFLFDSQYADAAEDKSLQLIERISKDYTKKFCNSIGFGLSKNSAMNFANKENKMIFKNKKGIDSLNRELLANKISISVVENCGYPINLKGENGIDEFKNDYILMNK